YSNDSQFITSICVYFSSLIRQSLRSTLFPYTTLFRSLYCYPVGRFYDQCDLVSLFIDKKQNVLGLHEENRSTEKEPSAVCLSRNNLVSAIFLLWYGGKPSRKRGQFLDIAYGVYHLDCQCLGRDLIRMRSDEYIY